MHSNEKAQADARLQQATLDQQTALKNVAKDPAIVAQEARFSKQLDQYNAGDYSSAPEYQALVTTGTKMRDMNLTPTGDEALLNYSGGNGDTYTRQLADDRKRAFMGSVASMVPGVVNQDISNAQYGLFATSGMNQNVDLAKAGLAQGEVNSADQMYQFSRRPSWLAQAGLAAIGGASAAAGSAFGTSFGKQAGCWVASEIFGGWFEPKTVAARFYVNNLGPKFFLSFYLKHGEAFARRLKGRKLIKLLIRPIFEYFAWRGKCAVDND